MSAGPERETHWIVFCPDDGYDSEKVDGLWFLTPQEAAQAASEYDAAEGNPGHVHEVWEVTVTTTVVSDVQPVTT